MKKPTSRKAPPKTQKIDLSGLEILGWANFALLSALLIFTFITEGMISEKLRAIRQLTRETYSEVSSNSLDIYSTKIHCRAAYQELTKKAEKKK